MNKCSKKKWLFLDAKNILLYNNRQYLIFGGEVSVKKLLVLIINDMVIFPNNEVRVEFDNNYDKQMVEIVDLIDDNLMLIVNPIDDGETSITSFPKYGVLGRLKLKMNVPNGKTRIVIEGLDRVELHSVIEDGYHFRADYSDIEIVENEEAKSYFDIVVKSLEKYVSKVSYMGNAIMSQLNSVDNLSDLCDLIVSFLPEAILMMPL